MADVSVDTEVVRAAALWLRFVTLWESAEEDELLTKAGELVDEWQEAGLTPAAEIFQKDSPTG